jgi:hypothetical protein
MPETATQSAVFASCASSIDALMAAACVVLVAGSVFGSEVGVGGLLYAICGVCFVVLAVRDRGKPYIEVLDGHVRVHESRRRIRDIELNRVVRMQRGMNKTILRLEDGTRVSIDHALFATSREAQRFTSYLREEHGIESA